MASMIRKIVMMMMKVMLILMILMMMILPAYCVRWQELRPERVQGPYCRSAHYTSVCPQNEIV